MNKSEWQVLGLTALVLIIVTASAVYVNQTDPQIRERNQLQQVRQILNTPSSAEYLGKHTYNISNEMNIVYTWKDQTTLYEAQITPEGTIKTYIYTLQSDELNATMSPLLAQAFSEKLFTDEIKILPDYFEVTGPTYTYSRNYFNQGGLWRLNWGLKLANYTVLGADFSVRVFTQTGKATLHHNSFNRTLNITLPPPPTITEEQAIKIATDSYLKQLEYPVIQSSTSRGLGITIPGFDTPPNALVWNIVVDGMGYGKGYMDMVHTSTYYLIDAHTGENYIGITVGSGATWSMGSYPYYGSAYPITLYNYPYDYQFPVTLKEAKHYIFNHSLQGIPDRLAWEYIILQLDEENHPIIASYWTRTSGEYKTGTLAPINSLKKIQRQSQTLDGYLIIIDAETGELIQEIEYQNIGEPVNDLSITREQAINITATSQLTDPENKIIAPESLMLAEPRVIKPDWISQLTYMGDFRRLYISEVNQTESRLYWLIEYALYPEVHGGYTGTYLVDAETGQIALALEDYPLPDLLFRGYAPETISLKRGETISFNITVKAAATMEAQLPVTLTVDQIPVGVTALIQRDTQQLSNQKTANFNVTLTASEEAVTGIHITIFGISLLGKGTSAHTKLVITE